MLENRTYYQFEWFEKADIFLNHKLVQIVRNDTDRQMFKIIKFNSEWINVKCLKYSNLIKMVLNGLKVALY